MNEVDWTTFELVYRRLRGNSATYLRSWVHPTLQKGGLG